MRAQVILEHVQHFPFQLFTLFLADGRSFSIRHLETLAVQRNAIHLMLMDERKMMVIDPLLIVSLEWMYPENASLPGNMKRRKPGDDEFDSEENP